MAQNKRPKPKQNSFFQNNTTYFYIVQISNFVLIQMLNCNWFGKIWDPNGTVTSIGLSHKGHSWPSRALLGDPSSPLERQPMQIYYFTPSYKSYKYSPTFLGKRSQRILRNHSSRIISTERTRAHLKFSQKFPLSILSPHYSFFGAPYWLDRQRGVTRIRIRGGPSCMFNARGVDIGWTA